VNITLRPERKTGSDYAEDLAAAMLASTLGMISMSMKAGMKKEIFKISGKIVRTLM